MSEPQLIYPTIDLFVYDLREGFGDDAEQVQSNRYHFWRKIYHDLADRNLTQLRNKLNAEGVAAENAEALYVELLGARRFQEFDASLDGRYYPVQFGDTYALLVDCSGHKTILPHRPKPLTELATIKQQVDQQIRQGSPAAALNAGDAGDAGHDSELGRTWLVWGQLTEPQQDSAVVAEKCYTQVVGHPNWQRDFVGQGKLLGGDLYELWQQTDPAVHSPAHVLICLFPATDSIDSISDRISNIYFDLMRLFCFRHKIIWAHRQTLQLRQALKTDFSQIKHLTEQTSRSMTLTNITALQSDLTQALEILARYSPNITALYYQGRTIAINLTNYQKRLSKISNHSPQTDLTFQAEFLDQIAPQYQRQIEADRERFAQGLALLQNLMEANRGRIELYQAERDRRFGQTIAIAGVGLATSQIAASILVAQTPPQPNTPTVLVPAFWKSLVIGAIFGAIVWGLILMSQQLRRR